MSYAMAGRKEKDSLDENEEGMMRISWALEEQ
jgi:hypothetical protein